MPSRISKFIQATEAINQIFKLSLAQNHTYKTLSRSVFTYGSEEGQLEKQMRRDY
jgi:hypothetical protein